MARARKLIELQDTLTNDEMVDFILDNGLRDFSGKIDYNSAKHMAGGSEKGWTLTDIEPGRLATYIAVPRKKRNPLPPIVLQVGENEFEVLDGRHRVGEANYLKEPSIKVYLGVY